jgi:hypothetical protein
MGSFRDDCYFYALPDEIIEVSLCLQIIQKIRGERGRCWLHNHGGMTKNRRRLAWASVAWERMKCDEHAKKGSSFPLICGLIGL